MRRGGASNRFPLRTAPDNGEVIDSNAGMTMSTATKTISRQKTTKAVHSTAEEKVKAEIASMLQINGNTPTAHGWVPRVVMMAYERRCANNPANDELAECFSVAQAIAARS